MKQIVFMFLLLYWNTQSARSEIFSQSVTEGDNAFLYCKHEGKVVWSKDRDGQRRTILSVQNEEIKKYIDDPHNRYRVLSDLSLHIKSVSLSDSGIYNCNENTVVNLTVTASVTPITTVISQRSTVKESKSTQSNTHPQFTSTVTPITTVISQRSTVKESKSTQSNTHPQFTSAVTPITTVSSQRSTVKESKSTQSNTHPKFTSTVTPITTVISQSVKESKSTQSNTHPKFTSAVTPITTVISQRSTAKESKSTQSNTHPKFTSTVTPITTVSSQSSTVKESKSTQSNTHPQFTSTDSVGVIVAVSCGVVFVALVLLILACIKRKGFDSLDGPTNKYTHPKFTSTPDEEYSFVVYHRI
ncbi:mucin-4-like isoform X2 [Myxocyprinus asiaticus]|uniref:mucin-4-like isoform X2 n=1 Tax=Myxocyprinus asiaticus TaxID=70543 RepID=UPI0022233F95|nr:mucin-4-like isoform X2 [Myxocyprinus asiaticus]